MGAVKTIIYGWYLKLTNNIFTLLSWRLLSISFVIVGMISFALLSFLFNLFSKPSHCGRVGIDQTSLRSQCGGCRFSRAQSAVSQSFIRDCCFPLRTEPWDYADYPAGYRQRFESSCFSLRPTATTSRGGITRSQ